MVFVEITTSLDGFIAGPNDSPEQGLGEGGERLHEWVYGLASWREPHGLEGGEVNRDSEILGEAVERTGAVVLGKRMFENAREWGDEPPFHVPVFVLTHEAREPLAKTGTTFTFVTDGIESALGQAKEAAGGKDVSVAGGANTIQQFLSAGLVDELQIHIAPLLLGGGIRLFENLGAEQIEVEGTRVVESPAVTHLKFRVVSQR
jgi:dihydrofolate reductase